MSAAQIGLHPSASSLDAQRKGRRHVADEVAVAAVGFGARCSSVLSVRVVDVVYLLLAMIGIEPPA